MTSDIDFNFLNRILPGEVKFVNVKTTDTRNLRCEDLGNRQQVVVATGRIALEYQKSYKITLQNEQTSPYLQVQDSTQPLDLYIRFNNVSELRVKKTTFSIISNECMYPLRVNGIWNNRVFGKPAFEVRSNSETLPVVVEVVALFALDQSVTRGEIKNLNLSGQITRVFENTSSVPGTSRRVSRV
tara:strand:+ start:9631 stop:10185 length:555 start_codon:yes stop_codon:yes gene_type:complete